jgi:hypothetical protein
MPTPALVRRFLLVTVASLVTLAALPAPGIAASAPGPASANGHADRVLADIAVQIDPQRERRTLERLVGFGTRQTASETRSATRGIGAARRWVRARFARIAAACGGCLAVDSVPQVVTGKRFARPTRIVDELGIQRGTSDPDRIVVISAHLDSRVSDVMNATADAPGADDDGSGVAAVLEAARVLSHYRFPATIVYAVLSGEEQGLYGGKLLAATALALGWRVEAQLNNDIIGNVHGQNGVVDDTHVRVFSEGPKSGLDARGIREIRYNGGEVDSPARNLARYIARLAPRVLWNFHVRMIYRTDRFDRGGDQMPMLAAGFPAVRFTEAVENYHRQHQDVRVANGIAYGDVLAGVDFAYLAQVTRLNAITLASLAWAPPPPTVVRISGAVTPDTVVQWSAVPSAVGYRVWWRDTTDPQWRYRRWAGNRTRMRLPGVVIDDYFFGISSVSADGFASPVEFPGSAGAFWTPSAVNSAPKSRTGAKQVVPTQR